MPAGSANQFGLTLAVTTTGDAFTLPFLMTAAYLKNDGPKTQMISFNTVTPTLTGSNMFALTSGESISLPALPPSAIFSAITSSSGGTLRLLGLG